LNAVLIAHHINVNYSRANAVLGKTITSAPHNPITLKRESIMPTGSVKWFNNAKGYGFIVADEGSEDLFAHYSAITMDGYKTLKAGQKVNFDIIQGDKGQHAINIKPEEIMEKSNLQPAMAM
jgi:cold shock protein